MNDSTPVSTIDRLLERILAEPNARSVEDALRWLRAAPVGGAGAAAPRTSRLAELAAAIDAHPRADRLRTKLREIWQHPSAVRLLAETGLPSQATLFSEAIDRAVDRVVPRLHPEDDLGVMVSHLALTEDDARWVESLPPGAVASWREVVAPRPGQVADAARLVACRAASVGITREFLQLERPRADGESPFLELAVAVERVVSDPAGTDALERYGDTLARCRMVARAADRLLEQRGVSTDLLYRLELLESLLARLDTLVRLFIGDITPVAVAGELVRGGSRQRGIRSLARHTAKRLALKVTEHTAETGEHYLVRDRVEWEATSRSAAGGGVLTAGTALLKYLIAGLSMAPVLQGLAAALNYSASFIAMQFAHFTLASKQPAMTGAALAAALDDRDHLEEQVELVAGITRSQMAATLGNVLATIPAAAAVVALFRLLGGAPPLPPDTAIHSLHAVHPFLSLTVPFAMLTGGFLWLASLAAGWAANWSAFRGLPEALAQHRRIKAVLGAAGAQRLGSLVERHFSGIVGYLTLGLLLGFVPVAFDRFLGIPLEVRHVTLQAASLTLAAGSVYGTEAFHWGEVAWGALGIALIATANLGVSFFLALRTAARARDLAPADWRRLTAALRAAFRKDPRRFLWRPRKSAAGG
ncbi:MAG: hypothetical protein SFV24_23880 [Gemmatimonadales bacterium]|nr:hypothetical protein [Gemmatimonadales bacterium]